MQTKVSRLTLRRVKKYDGGLYCSDISDTNCKPQKQTVLSHHLALNTMILDRSHSALADMRRKRAAICLTVLPDPTATKQRIAGLLLYQ